MWCSLCRFVIKIRIKTCKTEYSDSLHSRQTQSESWQHHSMPCPMQTVDKSWLERLAFRSCPTGPAGRGWSNISTSGCWGRLYSRQRSQMSFFNCCKSCKNKTRRRRWGILETSNAARQTWQYHLWQDLQKFLNAKHTIKEYIRKDERLSYLPYTHCNGENSNSSCGSC